MQSATVIGFWPEMALDAGERSPPPIPLKAMTYTGRPPGGVLITASGTSSINICARFQQSLTS